MRRASTSARTSANGGALRGAGDANRRPRRQDQCPATPSRISTGALARLMLRSRSVTGSWPRFGAGQRNRSRRRPLQPCGENPRCSSSSLRRISVKRSGTPSANDFGIHRPQLTADCSHHGGSEHGRRFALVVIAQAGQRLSRNAHARRGGASPRRASRPTRGADSSCDGGEVHTANNQTSGFKRSTSPVHRQSRISQSFVLEKLPPLDLQPLRDTGIVDRHVALRPLDRTQLAPVDPAEVRQGFLTQAAVGPMHVNRQNVPRLAFVRPFHKHTYRELTTLSCSRHKSRWA
jgi:hypothetical protein